MSDPINLSKPHRTIRAGVILVNSSVSSSLIETQADPKPRITEILDIAPIDVFNAISTKFIKNFPEELVSLEMQAQTLDVDFHWVNETGKQARLTAGAVINPTV